MQVVDCGNGGLFFVYGYRGTGKTFLWKTLSASIRCKGDIVLNVASSGIASLLRLMCHIKPDDQVADLLRKTKLIIWDEAPMIHRHAFEALDRTMKDIFKSDDSVNSDMSFGGKVMVLGGDFRQILPVKPNGSR
ncbi:ATP-dependent DNA helicase PIF1-like [Helianthus annuus]|uniref:ATP-dependent DNA helicase PIF1-like n=1 Tax=Helianthus annuus TaxID=4232 RepID=UPI000B902804|nr:ATP-dependent DNA helicase PIF1-like [Helianthus annuus]